MKAWVQALNMENTRPCGDLVLPVVWQDVGHFRTESIPRGATSFVVDWLGHDLSITLDAADFGHKAAADTSLFRIEKNHSLTKACIAHPMSAKRVHLALEFRGGDRVTASPGKPKTCPERVAKDEPGMALAAEPVAECHDAAASSAEVASPAKAQKPPAKRRAAVDELKCKPPPPPRQRKQRRLNTKTEEKTT